MELIEEAVLVAENSDIAIIMAGDNRNVETEARDRETIQLPFGQDELIRAVTAVNPKTIVVVIAGAACDLNATDSVAPAILYAWFNGSEAGNALTDILFGNVNPSGKLPFTIPEKLDDVGAHALHAYPGNNFTVEYKEGILVGYRWFDTRNIEPKFCFGFGLSYSRFEYSAAKTNRKVFSPGQEIKISVSVQNKGPQKGKETLQAYVRKSNSEVMRADKELKAFKKIELQPGQKESVTLEINVDDLSYYNIATGGWVVEPGEYSILLGSSSRDIRQELTIQIKVM